MAWFRVRGKWTEPVRFPDLCPNCLGSPANTPIEVSRTFTASTIILPVEIGYTFRVPWPHCEDCVQFMVERRRLAKQFKMRAVLWLFPLLLPGCVGYFRGGCDIGGFFASWLGLWAVAVVATVWRYHVRVARLPAVRPRTVHGDAVRLLRAGRAVFSKAHVMDVKFANPAYAKAFAEVNSTGAELKYNAAVLEGAVNLRKS